MMSDGRLLCGDRPQPATAPRCHRRVAVWPTGQGHHRERLPLPRGRQRGVRLVLSTTGRGHERLHRGWTGLPAAETTPGPHRRRHIVPAPIVLPV